MPIANRVPMEIFGECTMGWFATVFFRGVLGALMDPITLISDPSVRCSRRRRTDAKTADGGRKKGGRDQSMHNLGNLLDCKMRLERAGEEDARGEGGSDSSSGSMNRMPRPPYCPATENLWRRDSTLDPQPKKKEEFRGGSYSSNGLSGSSS